MEHELTNKTTPTTPFTIVPYTPADHAALLALLLQLHSAYFSQNAAPRIQEMNEEKNVQRSYERYVASIGTGEHADWNILMAKDTTGKAIGFIIGSITQDDSLVLSNIGNIEDWYVEKEYRALGIGSQLYQQLEQWFKEKDCHQVVSGTWSGNTVSVSAHQKAGFFISEIKFSKKL